MKKYAHIIIDNRASETDRPYTYLIGQEFLDTVEVGMRVVVPFGRGNRLIKGLVINIEDEYRDKYRLKKIVDVLDEKPLISKDLIKLALWMSDYYLSPYLDSFRTVLPPGDFKKIKTEFDIVDREIDRSELSREELSIISLIEKDIRGLEEIKSSIGSKNINKSIRNLESLDILKSRLVIETRIDKSYENYIILNDRLESPLENLSTRAYKQREIVEYLEGKEAIKVNDLLKIVDTSLSTVRELEKKDLVIIEQKEVYREAVKKQIPYYRKHKLNKEQELAVKNILGSSNRDHLLHGVTGSGKTEVYLQLVEEMLRQGKDSIVLVPEISLTPQTIDRFVGRFGDNVAVLHSRLSYGERFDEWRKIRDGDVKIVVGARSAVFAPFNNLGLIVIDEEHDSSYKSSMNPKYDTLEVANKRLEYLGGKLVRGSATPSLESYYQSLNSEVRLIELKNRVNKKKLPKISIVDMKEELNQGNTNIFSRSLYRGLKNNLEKGKQSILFLNRRGHSTFVSCRECGYVVKCNECAVSLTYHSRQNICKCHYCGLAIKTPRVCPECSSRYIKYFGIGTEQVEEFTKEIFPKARVDRMDFDTVSRKGSYEIKLDKMKKEETDILIGTQMIAKGLDFENVTLVGIIAADTSLNLPDYRSSEKTFQLITQVAGRAGRGDQEGQVIVQTYTPDHYSINYSKNHDYIGFYEEEIFLRKAFDYPPFKEIFSILIYGEVLSRVSQVAFRVKHFIEDLVFAKGLKVEIIGPNPAPLDRIKNNFRYQILFKLDGQDSRELKEIINRVCINNEYNINVKGIKYNIDIDPISIL